VKSLTLLTYSTTHSNGRQISTALKVMWPLIPIVSVITIRN